MLYTNLKHIESQAEFELQSSLNKFVSIICGRMDKNSVQAYRNAELLKSDYPQIYFFDMEINNPELVEIFKGKLSEEINNTPFILFYKKGQLIATISGPLSKKEMDDQIISNFKLKRIIK